MFFSLGVMALLFFSELWAYLKVDTVSHMRVSGIHEIKETTVHLHITFPHLGCEELSLEVENIRVSPVHMHSCMHNLFRIPVLVLEILLQFG